GGAGGAAGRQGPGGEQLPGHPADAAVRRPAARAAQRPGAGAAQRRERGGRVRRRRQGGLEGGRRAADRGPAPAQRQHAGDEHDAEPGHRVRPLRRRGVDLPLEHARDAGHPPVTGPETPTGAPAVSTPLLAGFPVVIERPVRWGEMPPYRHVNNVVYFRYFESARLEYFRRLGWFELEQETGVSPILAATQARFRRPLTYPDTVWVGARAAAVAEDRFTLEHLVVSRAQG